jgi:hypothetical protein
VTCYCPGGVNLRRRSIVLPHAGSHADLGGGLIKLRVARPGAGKRGAYRTIIAYRKAQRAFFLHGFPKNDRANIRPDELADLKHAAAGLFAFSDTHIAERLAAGRLLEVNYEQE